MSSRYAASFWDHVAWAEKNPGLFGIMHLLGPQGLGREEPQTSIFFSDIRYPGLGREGRKDCALVDILKDFGISMKTLSYYS